ncbi:MAG: hypothetical protein BEN19_06685, partial [Epulopiscium sp. Nuni2H_MBin003]
KFILKYLQTYPMSFVYKCFRTNKIKLNGKKPKGMEKLCPADNIKIFLTDDMLVQNTNIMLTEKTFSVIYEDANILIVDKPIGVLTQKAQPTDVSLAEEVLSYLQENSINGFKPAPLNRLDRNTSGIVLVGKNLVTATAISSMLQQKQLTKNYLAIVSGHIKKEITLNGYHLKKRGVNEVKIVDFCERDTKEIITKVVPIMQKDDLTLVEVELVTGKTHQIRAQLQQVGHPIIGDYKYGDSHINNYFKCKYNLTSQFLCAYKIKFNTCNNILAYLEDKVFFANVPEIFTTILEKEKFIKTG